MNKHDFTMPFNVWKQVFFGLHEVKHMQVIANIELQKPENDSVYDKQNPTYSCISCLLLYNRTGTNWRGM